MRKERPSRDIPLTYPRRGCTVLAGYDKAIAKHAKYYGECYNALRTY